MRPCVRQPQGAARLSANVANYVVCSAHSGGWRKRSKGGWSNLAVNDHTLSVGPGGYCWVPFSSGAVGLNTGIASGPLYSVLFAFEVRTAAITAASNPFTLFGQDANASDGCVVGGAPTGYLENETISMLFSSGRSGIADEVSVGLHTLVIQWNAQTSRYDFWLDGLQRSRLSSADEIDVVETVSPTYVGGRNYSGGSHVCPILFAWGTDPSANLRQYASNPFGVFQEPQWLYTGMGSGSWTPLEVTG